MGYGYDEGLGYETVRFLWKRPHVGWRELKMRQALLAEGNRDFPTIIADQGIVLYNKKQTENFQFMLRSYMEELRKAQTMSNLHSTMGWKENNTQFVLGDTIYIRQEDGSVVKQDVKSSARTSSIESLYTSKGSLENWSAFTKILDNPSMAATQFALGASFSSVLYKFTGLKGLTLSLYGPKGTGKTLTQYYMQSIWGDPTKLHFAAKFTQNALYSRMAYHNNLIFTVDEATLMEAKDVGDFVYTVTQGRDKARLSRAAEEREAKTWETLACVSTNRSLVGSIGTTYGYEGDAQLSRLLEIEMQPSPIFAKSSEGGRTIYRRIHQDFGVAGPVFIEYLLSLGEAGIQARVDEAMRTFGVRYGVTFAGHERFWETSIVLVDLALQIADELGLIKFNWRVAIEFVLRQINASRVAAQVSKADAFDVIAAYAADYASKAVTLMHTVGDNRPSYDNDAMSRTSEIRVRYDVFRTTKKDPFTHGTITFDRVHFRSWLSKHGGDYKSFVDELTSEKAIATPKSGKLCLGKDTPYRLPQTYVVAANISHPKLKHLLNNIDDDIMNNMLGQLSVVQN